MSVGLIPPGSPATGLGEQLIGVFSNSASATLDCATRNQGAFTGNLFQADFDAYRIEVMSGPPSANQNFLMRVSTDGGATYDSSASYASSNYVYGPAGVGGSGVTGQTAFNLLGAFTISTTSTKSINTTIRINNPLSSAFHKDMRHLYSWYDGTNIITGWGAGQFASTTPINALRFLFATGATFTAVVLVFGIPKTAAVVSGGVLTGRVVQVVNTETGAVATGTTLIPLDDTIPQNTEGDQYMSLSITPTSATNKLKIEAVCVYACSVNQTFVCTALFQDSTANALAASIQEVFNADGNVTSTLVHYMTAGTTTATTFKIRIGANGAATITFNGRVAGRLYGGVMASSITITEIAV